MTINHGLYTDTLWAVAVVFESELPAGDYVLEMINRNGAVEFIFRSSGASSIEGIIDKTDIAELQLNFTATEAQHANVVAGLYRLSMYLDGSDDTWVATGKALIGAPGAKSTYLQFDRVTGNTAVTALPIFLTADAAAASASANAAAASAAAAAADAVETAENRVQTGLDAASTAADRAQTQIDAAATAADAVATDADMTAAETARIGAETAQTAAETAQAGAVVASTQAAAASQASGPLLFYDTKAAADAALAGLSNLQVVEVFADESRSGRRTRYRKESGVYLFKLNMDPARLTADACALVPLTLSGVQNIDGVTGVAGTTTVLATQQTEPATNGLYMVQSGAWTRHPDFDTAAEADAATVLIKGGNTQKGRSYKMVSVGAITLGSTPLLFWNNEGGGGGSGSLIETARKARGVYVILGDSNTVGRNGTHFAYLRGRGHPERGPWRNWTKYAMAASGMKLNSVVGTIASGSQVAPAVDYYPGIGTGFDGNVWRAINALMENPNAILEINLGINDFGLGVASRAPGGSGDPPVFRGNMERLISFVLAMTTAHILLRIPAPFGGDADFIVGPTNTTEWALDSSDGTIATGAREASAEMIGIYREWIGRHPRVSVFDAPKEVYGADFCNNTATDCLDMQVGSTFNGTAVPAASRRLIDDTLHASDLGKRREEQAIMKMLFSGVASNITDHLIIGSRFDFSQVIAGHWFHYESLTNSAGNSLFRVRASRENLMWQDKLSIALSSSQLVPGLEALAEAERALLLGNAAALQDLLGWRNRIGFYFPETGNVYFASDVTISNTVTDSDLFTEKYFSLLVTGVNMATEFAAAQGGNVGNVGSPIYSNAKRRAFCFIDKPENLAHLPRTVSFTVVGTLGISGHPFNPVASDIAWQIRRFFCHRADNTPTTPIITLRLHNLSDGRFVEGAINFATSAGMEVGTWTFSSGVRVGTFTANATNIDAAIAAGIWPAGSNGQVTMKNNYYLDAIVTGGTLGAPAQVVVFS